MPQPGADGVDGSTARGHPGCRQLECLCVWAGGWGMSSETTGMGQILLSYADFGFHAH